MDVQGVSGGLAATQLAAALSAPAGSRSLAVAALAGLAQQGDSMTALLRELSAPEVLRFLDGLDRALPAEIAARVEALLGAAVTAAAEGNVPHALAKLAELAALDPGRAQGLESEKGLEPIRGDVKQLVTRLTSESQHEAERRLDQAVHLLPVAVAREIAGQAIRPEIAILIAGRLLEAGGYANCTRSAEISQSQINLLDCAPVPAALALPLPGVVSSLPGRQSPAMPKAPSQWMAWFRRLWARAPLLILLVGWLAVGLVCGSVFAIYRGEGPEPWHEFMAAIGFDLWGVGFLVLVLFGFWARVRRPRR